MGACYHAASVNLLALGISGDGGVSGVSFPPRGAGGTAAPRDVRGTVR